VYMCLFLLPRELDAGSQSIIEMVGRKTIISMTKV